jgi:hypothetical protein
MMRSAGLGKMSAPPNEFGGGTRFEKMSGFSFRPGPEFGTRPAAEENLMVNK